MYINKYKVGGIIFYKNNLISKEQSIELIENIKLANNNKTKLFLTIDEEGGTVQRMPSEYTDMKSPRQIEEGEAFMYGTNLGKRVESLGLNLNFAPSLDIAYDNKSAMRSRAYGDTPESVSLNGIEAFKGIESTGIISTVKHFPGIGDTSVDSHINFPTIDKDKEELLKTDLLPFIEAIDNGVGSIMVGHSIVSGIDESNPSTLSSKVINDLLREELGFKGVVIADSFTMFPIISRGLAESTVDFLNAGGDMIIIGDGLVGTAITISVIKKAVSKGEILEKDLDEKVMRILKLKEHVK